jgi:hypothetical protein
MPSQPVQPTVLGDPRQPLNVTRWIERIAKTINGNSPRGHVLTGTSPGIANTAFTVQHGLGRIPVTIDGQHTNNGGILYQGGTWTTTAVVLKCTTASAQYTLLLT